MRVLQLIDSLNPGGAERMAVNIANALDKAGVASYLCATREEGELKKELAPSVGFCFLKKRNALDFMAYLKLIKFVKQHKIEIVHAHSTSFFFATLLKITLYNIKIVWHDHYGNSELLNNRKHRFLKICSFYFTAIISVNKILKNWSEEKLKTRQVFYLSNFVSPNKLKPTIALKDSNSIKIISVANLRPQKDHINLFEAFKIIQKKYLNVSLHIVGRVDDNQYLKNIEEFIYHSKTLKVYIYGSQAGIPALLKTADIGVLSSISEGLPIALLEYGAAGLAVVSTDVGECKEVINGLGKIVPPKNPEALAAALLFYIENKAARRADGLAFATHIKENYAEDTIIPKLLDIYKNTSK
ncbi:glycosyltransferase [Aequorivita marisscotiae]|uniref:Glycosyltransferase n=1 Tax=Aequorivita marisscotiae TaxID=3040348 RepID=A0ABY8KTG3_9FLAO|nr:glycosyltransferase [Aequorivita sp. Ant34-E75]WGF92729.1 glycosyltransferase [Aequorivita sp. Ant34-E75]